MLILIARKGKCHSFIHVTAKIHVVYFVKHILKSCVILWQFWKPCLWDPPLTLNLSHCNTSFIFQEFVTISEVNLTVTHHTAAVFYLAVRHFNESKMSSLPIKSSWTLKEQDLQHFTDNKSAEVHNWVIIDNNLRICIAGPCSQLVASSTVNV